MTALLTFVVLLTATTAQAEHVWRLYCGDPPTPRVGVFDSSAECWADAGSTYAEDHCQDTNAGPRFAGKHLAVWDKFRTCAEVQRDVRHCLCQPESVP